MPRQPLVLPITVAIAAGVFAGSIKAQTASSSSALGTFRPRFESVLKHHGIVGGGFALVRGRGEVQTIVFGEAKQDTRQPIDDATAYNWASITKTMTAIA